MLLPHKACLVKLACSMHHTQVQLPTWVEIGAGDGAVHLCMRRAHQAGQGAEGLPSSGALRQLLHSRYRYIYRLQNSAGIKGPCDWGGTPSRSSHVVTPLAGPPNHSPCSSFWGMQQFLGRARTTAWCMVILKNTARCQQAVPAGIYCMYMYCESCHSVGHTGLAGQPLLPPRFWQHPQPVRHQHVGTSSPLLPIHTSTQPIGIPPPTTSNSPEWPATHTAPWRPASG
jgi:hypothetical protein